MNRDLLFFLAGLAFGMAGGYFLFRAIQPGGVSGGPSEAAVASRPAGVESSSIGLDDEPVFEELDEAAVERLEAEAEERPSDSAVRAELGSLYASAGRFDEASRWLEAAVSLAPADLDVRSQLAVAYLNEGRLTDAVGVYEGNLSRDPEHPASLLGLGRIRLYLQQDINGGLALWEKLIAVAPESPEARGVAEELEALKSAHGG